MNCLVPLETSNQTGPTPPAFPISYTLSQALPIAVDNTSFDLTPFNFSQAPTNIVPTLIKSDGSKSNLGVTPRQWTATSFACDFTAPTDDTTYVCSIQIFP